MTHIVPSYIKTKAQLKQVIADGRDVYLNDPSIVSPDSGGVQGLVNRHNAIYCTNHPKRSWFAEIVRDPKTGLLKVK